MVKNKSITKIPDEIIINKIIVLRDVKVMIDKDLAELYGITTKQLNQQVKRNIKRFPEDFMFQINQEEKDDIILSFKHLNSLKFSASFALPKYSYGVIYESTISKFYFISKFLN